MAHLFGFIANRPDLAGRFAGAEGEALAAVVRAEAPFGWGLGFHHHGELLLKRRPLDERPTLTLDAMLGDVATDLAIAHASEAASSSPRTEDTQPFRYRQWLFATTGTLGDDAVRARTLESLPEFLRRARRGGSDGELLFHLYLAFLHEAGKLELADVGARDSAAALAATFERVRRLESDAGRPGGRLDVLLATPDLLLAGRFGAPMGYRVLAGRADLEGLFADAAHPRPRASDLDACRLALVVSGLEGGELPPSWTSLADGAIMALTRSDEPLLLPTRT